MTTSNEFSEHYKTISNIELLSILENPDDYHPRAVEAAKEEFLRRQLFDAEMEEARQQIIASWVQKEKQKEKIKAIENKVKATGYTLLDTLNPIQREIPSTERTIRLIVIVFGGIYLYQLIKNYDLHLAFIEDIPRFPLTSMVYLLPLALLPIAVLTFWLRKPIGWTLLAIYFTWSACETAVTLYSIFRSSGSTGFDELFPRPSPEMYLLREGFYIAMLTLICKENIRQVFSVKKERIAPTIGLSILATAVLLLAALS